MLRRKKNTSGRGEGGTADAPVTAEQAEMPPPDAAPADAPGGNGAAAAEPAAAPTAVATAVPPGDAEDPGYVGDRLPANVWVEALLDTRPPPSREERERRAAADFAAAIAPSLDKLREAVPDASSPDEARRALEQREQQFEYPVDEEAELLKNRDIFRTEASVHYRIQRHLERPRGRVGWTGEWRPPEGLVRSAIDSPRRSMPRGAR